jgi:ribosome modulation factor
MNDLDDPNYTPRTPQARARMEGYQAAQAGAMVETNPYAAEAEQFFRRIWLGGYREYVRTHPRGSVSTCWAAMQIRAGMR